ncbi:hypothetical protein EIP91_008303 [Steccherinum ochraceum]|uniref:Thioester reductase (TE) domain-containing protein n=1 Tax=Steccherinum ochraceum TaxID=92696 RepID=A0A4R0R5C3_9APHY|nr:hypothetical protein EIP91_008303 [Steccherinum ochraceum]
MSLVIGLEYGRGRRSRALTRTDGEQLVGALRSSPDPAINALCTAVPQDLVFANPTIDKLAQAITRLVHPSGSDEAKNDAEEINAMIAKYTADLPAASSSQLPVPNDGTGLVVLLTGSTGGLGSPIMEKKIRCCTITQRVFDFTKKASPLVLCPKAKHAMRTDVTDAHWVIAYSSQLKFGEEFTPSRRCFRSGTYVTGEKNWALSWALRKLWEEDVLVFSGTLAIYSLRDISCVAESTAKPPQSV